MFNNKKFSELSGTRQKHVLEDFSSLVAAMHPDKEVPQEFLWSFLLDHKAAKAGSPDYYAIAVQVAKAICSAASVVCPIVNNL